MILLLYPDKYHRRRDPHHHHSRSTFAVVRIQSGRRRQPQPNPRVSSLRALVARKPPKTSTGVQLPFVLCCAAGLPELLAQSCRTRDSDVEAWLFLPVRANRPTGFVDRKTELSTLDVYVLLLIPHVNADGRTRPLFFSRYKNKETATNECLYIDGSCGQNKHGDGGTLHSTETRHCYRRPWAILSSQGTRTKGCLTLLWCRRGGAQAS